MRNAAQYLRMSTDQQRYSLANQTELIRAYAERHGFTVVNRTKTRAAAESPPLAATVSNDCFMMLLRDRSPTQPFWSSMSAGGGDIRTLTRGRTTSSFAARRA